MHPRYLQRSFFQRGDSTSSVYLCLHVSKIGQKSVSGQTQDMGTTELHILQCNTLTMGYIIGLYCGLYHIIYSIF